MEFLVEFKKHCGMVKIEKQKWMIGFAGFSKIMKLVQYCEKGLLNLIICANFKWMNEVKKS